MVSITYAQAVQALSYATLNLHTSEVVYKCLPYKYSVAMIMVDDEINQVVGNVADAYRLLEIKVYLQELCHDDVDCVAVADVEPVVDDIMSAVICCNT
eukprot:2027897-Amphidinium_carterae.1